MLINLMRAIRAKIRVFLGLGALGVIPKWYISMYLPKNPIILEAGACFGEDSVEMAKLWTNSKIYAFEPINETYKKLKQNTNSCKNIFCYNLALSDHNGITKMFVGGDSSSILKPKEHHKFYPEVTFDTTQKVETLTLDSWAEKNNVKKIDFLWLDMQGAELKVLKASKKILKTVKVIYTEVSLVEYYEGTPKYYELRTWLESKGFRVVREEIPSLYGGNVLFVKR